MSKRRTRKAIQILEKAKALLTENEWTQQAFYSAPHVEYRFGEGTIMTGDAFCAIGAVNKAAWWTPIFTPRTPAVMTAIRALGASVHSRATKNLLLAMELATLDLNSRSSVIRFNDKWANNKNQVLRLFSEAIERLNSEIDDPPMMEARIDAALSQRELALAAGPAEAA